MTNLNRRRLARTDSRAGEGAQSSQAGAGPSMLDLPTNAEYEEHLRSRSAMVWKISRETLRADSVKVTDAAEELGCDCLQALAALTGGAVLENGSHFFSATLDGFIAVRNERTKRTDI
jgi:hypothetical protein